MVGRQKRPDSRATMCRDTIAAALTECILDNTIDLDDAKEIGKAWLYNNANDFFRLGLPPC